MRDKVFGILGSSLLTSLSVLVVGSTCLAHNGPTQAFDAVYNVTTPVGSSLVRMLSDGKGHLRTETQSGGQKIISISDFSNNTGFSILEAQKMVVKSKMTGDIGVVDETSAKQKNAKSLGTKMIDGHLSQGWQYTSPQGTTDVWIGNDTHYLVRSESKTKSGNTLMTLKSFSKTTPGSNLFVVPSGYKVMEVPSSYTR